MTASHSRRCPSTTNYCNKNIVSRRSHRERSWCLMDFAFIPVAWTNGKFRNKQSPALGRVGRVSAAPVVRVGGLRAGERARRHPMPAPSNVMGILPTAVWRWKTPRRYRCHRMSPINGTGCPFLIRRPARTNNLPVKIPNLMRRTTEILRQKKTRMNRDLRMLPINGTEYHYLRKQNRPPTWRSTRKMTQTNWNFVRAQTRKHKLRITTTKKYYNIKQWIIMTVNAIVKGIMIEKRVSRMTRRKRKIFNNP
mmetsp:Transcript_33835/g.71131  ORF Transcript_33835/g.71131 Transcript_33835/m.71131 type:complete len:251 (-) Transcript_33835:554-1306(-)